MRDKEIGALPTTPRTASPQSRVGERWSWVSPYLKHHWAKDFTVGGLHFEDGEPAGWDVEGHPGEWFRFSSFTDGTLEPVGPSTAPIAPPVRPERIEVGQMWRLDGLEKVPHAIVRLDAENEFAWFDDGGSGVMGNMLRGGDWKFHGWADGYGPRAPVPSPGVAPGDLAFGPGSRDDSAMPNKCEWNIHNGMRPCGASDCIHLGAKASAPGGQGPIAAPSLPARRIEQNQASTLCHSCRLGDACTHGPKVREPFIPAVDEWDLLPDAGR